MQNRSPALSFRGFIAAISLACVAGAFAAQEVPQAFNFQGRFFNQAGTAPLTTTVDLKLSILSPAGGCLLYEEVQNNIDLSLTDGMFALSVGSFTGDPKRSGADPALAMAKVFQNYGVTRVDDSATTNTCPGGYSPNAGDTRRLRVTITTPSGGGTTFTVSPDQTISAVPNAVNAQTLQGLLPGSFILSAGNVTQTNLDSLTGATDIGGTLHNHDSRYLKSGGTGALDLGSGITSTTGQLGVGNSSPASRFEVDTGAAATIGAIVKGAAAQTANLQEWRKSDGTIYSYVDNLGVFHGDGSGLSSVACSSAPSSLQITGNLTMDGTGNILANATAFGNAAHIGTVGGFDFRYGAFNSGGAVIGNNPATGKNGLSTSSSTTLYMWNSSATGGLAFGTNNLQRMAIDSGGYVGIATPVTADPLARLLTATGTAASKGIVIQGSAAQTANLFEVQNSAGTVLHKIDASGYQTLVGDPTANLGSATKQYVDSAITTAGAAFVRADGTVPFTGDQSHGSHKLTNVDGITLASPTFTVGANTSFAQTGNNTTRIGGGPGGENITFGPSNRIFLNASQVATQAGAWLGVGSSPSYRFDIIENSATSLNVRALNSNVTSAVNTTAGALTTYGGYYSNTATRSAGANPLTNYGLWVTASGGQANYAANFAAGNVGIANATPANPLSVNAPTTNDTLAQILIATNATTNKGLVIQGAASQTANLQEWQSSTGTALASVDSAGNIVHTGNITSGTSHFMGGSTFLGMKYVAGVGLDIGSIAAGGGGGWRTRIMDNNNASTLASFMSTGSTISTFLSTGNTTSTTTSGSVSALSVTPTYNQAAATTANTDLLINRTETSIGSGAQRLIDAQVAGATKFAVTNAGYVAIGGGTPGNGAIDARNGISGQLLFSDQTNVPYLGLLRTASSGNTIIDISNAGIGFVVNSGGEFRHRVPNGGWYQSFFVNTERMRIDTSGNVEIGGATNATANQKLDVIGNTRVQGGLCVISGAGVGNCDGTAGKIWASTTAVGQADLAENMPVEDHSLKPGDVVAVEPSKDALQGIFAKTKKPYQASAIGVISTAPGVSLGSATENSKPVALAGRVPVNVTIEGGKIQIGDYLVASSVPGKAMRASDPSKGGVIGIALSSYDGSPVAERKLASDGIAHEKGHQVMVLIQPLSGASSDATRSLASEVTRLKGETESLKAWACSQPNRPAFCK